MHTLHSQNKAGTVTMANFKLNREWENFTKVVAIIHIFGAARPRTVTVPVLDKSLTVVT